MRVFLINILCLLACAHVAAQQKQPFATVELSGGYQVANLHWSIAGKVNGAPVNVLSEVKWSDLSGPTFNATLQLHPAKQIFIGAALTRSFIKSGNATDTDYGDNDRSATTYHAQLNSDEGSLQTCRLYGGYYFLQQRKWQVAAMMGYTNNKAWLYLLNHAAEVPGQKNLRSTYSTTWKGITGGIIGNYHATSWLAISADAQYSQVAYRAVADWNLIDAFQHPISFTQRANGFDLRMAVSSVFKLNHYLALFITGTYQHAETGYGTDELFLASGAVQTTRFNGAFTGAKQIAIGTRMQF
ncbi:hypothetical protein LX64_04989 [Chitinophaga skermanii]|uniref:Protochlamydia outer membrane protein domain-containing protein n=1 Tax=Chitinophaga skermanii TaxID=331697 RepID=A0A327Q776_9BACT|nr:hypothetical protein [Chitinophaga skermanii]RAI97686.1 hypothetical protein LX64_04989 [Chitinophaga skermanii]